jgi:hypothetical protein
LELMPLKHKEQEISQNYSARFRQQQPPMDLIQLRGWLTLAAARLLARLGAAMAWP